MNEHSSNRHEALDADDTVDAAPDRLGLLAAVALFVVGGAALLNFYQYPAIDLLAYISVAEKYAAGDIGAAINGCWGPLGSWVVVPFLWAGVDPEWAYRIVTLIIGLITLIGVRQLSFRFEMTRGIRRLVILLSAPLVLSFAYVPDLLIACVLVYYLWFILDPRWVERPRGAVWCGVLGSLAYLSKAYGLPLFVAHFTVASAWHTLRCGRMAVRRYATGMLLFALIAGTWVAVLSSKYGFTTGTVSHYTYAVLGPDSPGHPIFVDGFFAPPNDTAVSIWEDPSLIEVKGWSPLASIANFEHQVKMVLKNSWTTIDTYLEFSLLSLSILLFYCLLCLPLRRGIRSSAALPLFTVLLVPCGYLLTQVWPHWPGRGRYVWINAILFLLMGGHVLHRLLALEFFDRWRSIFLAVVFASTFLLYPARNLRSALTWNAEYYPIANELTELGLQGTTASDSTYHVAQYLSYRLGCQYYGSKALGATDDEVRADLERLGIDYYLRWRDSDRPGNVPDFLKGHPDVTEGRYPQLEIYSLKETK